jgi:hypothetical protein
MMVHCRVYKIPSLEPYLDPFEAFIPKTAHLKNLDFDLFLPLDIILYNPWSDGMISLKSSLFHS